MIKPCEENKRCKYFGKEAGIVRPNQTRTKLYYHCGVGQFALTADIKDIPTECKAKNITVRKKKRKMRCKICGSSRHTSKIRCCCNCGSYISHGIKCKQGIVTTREGLCSGYNKL